MHLRMLLIRCNPAEVTCVGLRFCRISVAEKVQGDA